MELNPIIICIAGGTGSGKSTLADNIKKNLKTIFRWYLMTIITKIIRIYLLKKE